MTGKNPKVTYTSNTIAYKQCYSKYLNGLNGHLPFSYLFGLKKPFKWWLINGINGWLNGHGKPLCSMYTAYTQAKQPCMQTVPIGH